MQESIFYQLSFVLAVAAAISLIAKMLRQPPIIGYIISGFLVGPALLNVIHAEEAFKSFSQIGIVLLLFMVGLGLNVAVIKRTGKPVLLTFLVRVLLLGGAVFGISLLVGLSQQEALLMAVALLFSSTIIVVKALSDKRGQSRLYGQIAIGVLLIEDIIATLALLFVSAGAESTNAADVGFLLSKGVALGVALVLIGAFIMPRLAKFFAASQELLFLFSIAWTFGVASAFAWMGYSIEVGALFAGVSLAHLPYAQAMSTRLRPLRDFFIILFFIGLGIELSLGQFKEAILPALIFSALIVVLKPILTMASLGALGYTRQTGFKVAIHLSQISEFSVILIVLAASSGFVGERLITIITLTALITIALSTYLIQYDDKLYRRLEKYLLVFERSSTKREVQELKHYPFVLLGYQKGGHEFVRTFRKMKKKYVVIDFDPEVVESMDDQGINHIYGDATDLELLEEMGVHHSELVVSTIGDTASNLLIAEHLQRKNEDALFICHANSYDEAAQLYNKGAAYVILPHFIGSEQIGSFIRKHGSDKQAFERYRLEHIELLGKAVIDNS